MKSDTYDYYINVECYKNNLKYLKKSKILDVIWTLLQTRKKDKTV